MAGFKKGTVNPLVIFTLAAIYLSCACCECTRKPVIFNFGDSNSDTGGGPIVSGFVSSAFPDGRTYFQEPGRMCDGRLILDFLCESVKTKYLTPFLQSVEPDFSNGANFAIAGASTYPPTYFSLYVQVNQFVHFHNRSLELRSKGYYPDLLGEEDFANGLYSIDIGQNDLSGAFHMHYSYDQVISKIPSFINQIWDAMWVVYRLGGRKFWVHNTGPLGCLPLELTIRKSNASELDPMGCIIDMNKAAGVFNSNLKSLCEELRRQMPNATIVYVDIYSVKYDLIANAAFYGFKNPLAACCGYGGPPYNYDPNNSCRQGNFTVCEEAAISWDGVHYTESANSIFADKIVSTNFSSPPTPFNFFCN